MDIFHDCTDVHGDQFWYKNARLHRENDLPAIIRADGTQEWWINDKRYRIVRADGTQELRVNGEQVIIFRDCNDVHGDQFWYKNARLHRENDLPAIIRADGTQEWWVCDKRHRDNGLPAVILPNGRQEWWENGVLYHSSQFKQQSLE